MKSSLFETLEDRRLFSGVAAPAPGGSGPAIQLHWRSGALAPSAHIEGEAVAVGGMLYCFGGYDQTKPHWAGGTEADVYNPATNSWAVLAPEPQAISNAGYATDGRYVYLAGGYICPPGVSQVFGTTHVWRYDTQTNQWTAFTALPAARGAGSLAIVGSQLHFVGGVDTHRVCQTTHWVLNLTDARPQWTASTPLPAGRCHCAIATLNGKIYVVGGGAIGNEDKTPTAGVFVFDPAHPSAWSAVKSLPQARSHDVVAVIDNQIVIACGITGGGGLLSSVIAYNPTANAWTQLASVPKAYNAPVGAFVGGELVITSGSSSDLAMKTTWFSNVEIQTK
jgi:N-acetylneuraminic acid mutarotase